MTSGPDGGSVVAVGSDGVAGLAVRVVVELTASGLVRARAAVTNTAPGTYTIEDLTVAFPVPSHAREVLDFAGRWGKERTPQRRELVVGTHLREGRKGRTGADAATVLSVGTPGFGFDSGAVWGVHTAWSGNHRHLAERLATGRQTVAGGELLLPGEVRLDTGETYEGPWVYAAYGDGLDDQARRFHRWLRARPQHPTTPRPVTINVWEAVYFDHDLARLTDLAERAARLGVERYVLDDGWFRHRRDDHAGLGDWYVDEDVWPDGLGPIVDRVRSLGMQFGLWFEPEMVNEDSDLARAHPEWIMQADGRLPVRSRDQQVLNLAIPEAFAYVLERMTAVIGEYAVDYVKWDHNRDLVEAGHPGGGAAVHEQTLAAYRLMATLRERFRRSRSSPARRAARGSTSACSSTRTGCGCPTTSTRSNASRCTAGRSSCSRRSCSVPTWRAAATTPRAACTTSTSAGDGPDRPPRHRVGPRRGDRGRGDRAGGLDRAAQGAPSAPARRRPGALGRGRPVATGVRHGGPDRRSAVFFLASIGRSDVSGTGRVRFPRPRPGHRVPRRPADRRGPARRAGARVVVRTADLQRPGARDRRRAAAARARRLRRAVPPDRRVTPRAAGSPTCRRAGVRAQASRRVERSR